MEKITILNPHRDTFEVDVIRYFIMGNANVLIYTLNEDDGDGNTRLYVTKIVDGLTEPLTDEEWTIVKASIRTIVNENRGGTQLTVRDLNFKQIEGLVVEHLKVFKIAKDVLSDLGANKTKFEETHVKSNIDDFLYAEIAAFEQPLETPKIEDFVVPSETTDDFLNEGVKPVVEQPVSVDYKALYEEIENEKKKLEEELFDLQSKTMSYQLKYDQIKKILEGEKIN